MLLNQVSVKLSEKFNSIAQAFRHFDENADTFVTENEFIIALKGLIGSLS
jgi:Ca2+-binding EF-hand superfamily protein